jgi:glutamate N-acetyltransferase/amino-acid N-acetyltransferase
MPSTSLTFSSRAEHRAWLATQSALPAGFRVGTSRFEFVPIEAPKPAKMALTLIALDQPTPDFAAVFTRNAFPGAPVIVGRSRLAEPAVGAVIINNKISNVCAPGGVAAAERICAATGQLLGLPSTAILPCSTGVIGWSLPVEAMLGALPAAVNSLAGGTITPAAEGIMTTDLYPKVRRVEIGGGSIVGIAKGAGMIEPNLATMLVYLLTDIAVPRATLRRLLSATMEDSFNSISIDSDTSTSDTVMVLSSGRVSGVSVEDFASGLKQVCADLAEDVVRNGEGVRHVIRVRVRRAADEASARSVGKAIVNAPLFKCAVAGNDANVGRLVQAIGKHVGASVKSADVSRLQVKLGGIEIFSGGVFRLDPAKEKALTAHMKAAELYETAPPKDGVFSPPVDFPAHERCVEIELDFDAGHAGATIFGGDLTHEYVSENADYRS